MERFMLKIMYDIPDRGDVESCQISKDVVSAQAEPVYTFIKPIQNKAKASGGE
jgi:ATP-dependent protease Clp ATPase subunit